VAVGANSYGEAADVAAMTRRFTVSGSFTTATNPTLAQVETWIDRVSATLNILLAEQGFAIPIVQADCEDALELFVTTEVADLANYANSAGRFWNNQQFTSGPWRAISKEAADFIGAHAEGFEQLGATRSRTGLDGLDYRATDDSGDDIEPMFSRKQFGNLTTDWDSDEDDD
jgi:hypothetical protein